MIESSPRIRRRGPVLICTLAALFAVFGGLYGVLGVIKLPAGGYDVPGSESTKVDSTLTSRFDNGGFSLVFLVHSPQGVFDDSSRALAEEIGSALKSSQYVNSINSYASAPPGMASLLVGKDGQTGLIAAQVEGGDKYAPGRAHELAKRFTGDRDGLSVVAGGQSLALYEINLQSQIDLLIIDVVAIPLAFLALVWIFRGVVAALIPMIIATFSIAGTAAALRTLSLFDDVSVFSFNLATALGLALAVDYSLIMVKRHREERRRGVATNRALKITMRTAGRTIAVSGLVVAAAISTLLVFPIYFLRSLAYSGVFVVIFSLIGALVVAPAIIALLGPRIDALDIRQWFRRGSVSRSTILRDHAEPSPEESFWYRTSMFAMRRPISIIGVVAVVFLIIGLPILDLKAGYPDDRVLPDSQMSRQAGDILRQQFSWDTQGSVRIVSETSTFNVKLVAEYARALSKVEGAVLVESPTGAAVDGQSSQVRTPGGVARDGYVSLSVLSTKDPFSVAGKDFVTRLREVPAPGPMLFGGLAVRDVDNVDGIADKIPEVLLIITIATFILMAWMTRSVLLPIKAIAMSSLALIPAVGATVWIFQEGHLGGLGTTVTGNINPAMIPLLACVSFGLSMDYEIFLLSRIREEWIKSPRDDIRRPVALGVFYTGPIVTAAAAIMSIAFVAITFSEVSFMRGLGFGLTMTVLLDAFVVRMLLVPAFMRLLGRANWWFPFSSNKVWRENRHDQLRRADIRRSRGTRLRRTVGSIHGVRDAERGG